VKDTIVNGFRVSSFDIMLIDPDGGCRDRRRILRGQQLAKTADCFRKR
jgi:hypothetical protein